MITQDIAKSLDHIKLDTLMATHSLHVLTMQNPEGSEVPPIKLIFFKSNTIGFIFQDKLYIKPDFFKGGIYNNVYVDSAMKIVIDTYKLKESVSIDFNEKEMQAIAELTEYLKQMEDNTNVDSMNEIHTNAENIAVELQHVQVTKLFNEINKKYHEFLKTVEDPEPVLEQKLQVIVTGLRESEDEKEISGLIAEGEKILNKLPSSELTKGAKAFIDKIKLAASKGKTDELLTASKQKLSTLKNNLDTEEKRLNDEYLEALGSADTALGRKDLKKAKHFYTIASELKPTANAPKEGLAKIARLQNKEK